jgi:predicted Zn-dependent peptidase
MNSVFNRTVLDNGLRVVSEKITSLRSISIGFWVNVGSRDEARQESGISHMIEHMVFKGTKKRSARQIAQSLESLGGHLNAFTGREQTCYYARVLDEHLPVAVDVLTDLLKNSLLTPADLEREKKVILEEIKDVQDNPADLIHDLYAQTLWKGQTAGQPVIGTSQTVSAFKRRNLLGFMGRSYRNDSMVVAASGNIDHHSLVELVAKHFGPDGMGSAQLRPRQFPRPFRNIRLVKKRTAQTHVCVGVPAFRFSHPQRYALTLLNIVLGGGMSSRLFQTIRERMGLVYSIYSFADFLEDTGSWGIYLATDAGQVQKAVRVVLRELKRITKQALTKNELEHAKAQLKGNLVISLENSSNRMNRLARNELYLKRYLSLDQTVAAIGKVKREDVQDVARQLFIPERLSATVLGPVNNGLQKGLVLVLGD